MGDWSDADCCSFSFSVYVAGKAAKAGYPPVVSSMPGPYYIPSVPVAGVPPPAVLMDKTHPPPLAPSDSSGGSQNGNLKCQAQRSVLLLGAGLGNRGIVVTDRVVRTEETQRNFILILALTMPFASLRATWSNFSSAVSTVSVCGCLIRSAGNGRQSSFPGPLLLLLQMFPCGRQKDEDDFRDAEAVAIFPLELMPCKLLSLGKAVLPPLCRALLALWQQFLLQSISLSPLWAQGHAPSAFLPKSIWRWTPSLTLQRAVGHCSCSAFAFVKCE